MALLDDLLREVNVTPQDYEREKALSGGARTFAPRQGVERSAELDRILALPRRLWEQEAPAYTEKVSLYLRAPGGQQNLRPVQAAALKDIHDMGGMFGSILVGGGKCAAETSEIFDTYRGRRRTLKELGPVTVASMGLERGDVIARPSVVFRSGEKPCVRLTLADGSSTVLSTDHPVFTHLGWVHASRVPVGVLVATPRSMPEPATPTDATDDEVLFAAYLLSDGGVSQSMASFTNGTEVVKDEFYAVAARITGEEPLEQPARRIEHLDRDAACEYFNVRKSRAFRDKWGIHGLAKDKRIPAEFWGLSRRQAALFLNRFWACDGYVNKGKGFEITLASEKMIDDLKFLLLRLGIRARKRHRIAKCEGTSFDAWRLSVTGSEVLPFLGAVGRVLGKELACDELEALHVAKVRNTNVDVVPVDARVARLIASEMGWPERGDPRAVGMRTAFSKALGATPGQWVGREQYARACERFGYRGSLAWLGTSDLAWEKAVSIEPVGVLPVCDLTVPGTGNFVCDNIVIHNTLISMLGFTVLGAKKPLLLIPAKLKEKTIRDMHALRKHWLIPGFVRVVSYELLGREQSAELLEEWGPDAIVLDECHRTKNRSAAVTRRISRFLASRPETKVVAMSGTITKRSIKDYAHIAGWCLRDLNPTPRDFNTLVEWSMVLDETRNDDQKLAPGALIQFCNAEEAASYASEPTRSIRRAYRRRLTETPGVIATQETALGASLRIEAAPLHDAAIWDAAHRMGATWERPDGEPMLDAIELWRHLREMGCGFYYRWNPPPPQAWLTIRRAWAKQVRDILRHNQRALDSEAQVMRAIDQKQYPGEILASWRAIRDSYKPQTEAVWVSTRVLEYAAAWAEREKGIVWVEHVEFGHELSRLSGLPFYWRQGQNAQGKPIEDHPPGEPLIASIASNAEGRNLQAWNQNLVVSWPPTGSTSEQLLGRTHRSGQEADEVVCALMATLPAQLQAFDRARQDAQYISDTTGQIQKLIYADVIVPELGPERDAMFADARAHHPHLKKPKKKG
jgi:hypothetical protein